MLTNSNQNKIDNKKGHGKAPQQIFELSVTVHAILKTWERSTLSDKHYPVDVLIGKKVHIDQTMSYQYDDDISFIYINVRYQ